MPSFYCSLASCFPRCYFHGLQKIVIDNAVLQRPVGGTEVVYPPFMNPILTLIEGKDPVDIMLSLTTIYFVIADHHWQSRDL